jgi:hypothetical protein
VQSESQAPEALSENVDSGVAPEPSTLHCVAALPSAEPPSTEGLVATPGSVVGAEPHPPFLALPPDLPSSAATSTVVAPSTVPPTSTAGAMTPLTSVTLPAVQTSLVVVSWSAPPRPTLASGTSTSERLARPSPSFIAGSLDPSASLVVRPRGTVPQSPSSPIRTPPSLTPAGRAFTPVGLTDPNLNVEPNVEVSRGSNPFLSFESISNS